jgi:hypothetical protein
MVRTRQSAEFLNPLKRSVTYERGGRKSGNPHKGRNQDLRAKTGVPVAGCAALEEIFGQVYKMYLLHETLGEMKFRSMLHQA